MQVTLTKVSRQSHKKDGSAYINKNGKPYTRLSIQTQEHGAKWLSGFAREDNASWKEGDTVDITVEEKGEYLNFSMPERQKSLGYGIEDRDRLLRVEIKVEQIYQMVKALVADPKNVAPEPEDMYPNF